MVLPVSGMPRRSALAVGAGGIVAALVPFSLLAEDLTFFRIATGGTASTFYPVGALIATVISNPPGVPSCEESGGSCGVPGLIAAAQSSEGGVENIEAVASGIVESGLSQSDIVYWAYNGTGIFAGSEPRRQLRLIGSLYPEVVQIVVRRDSGITSIPDMAESGYRSMSRVRERRLLHASSLNLTDCRTSNSMPATSSMVPPSPCCGTASSTVSS